MFFREPEVLTPAEERSKKFRELFGDAKYYDWINSHGLALWGLHDIVMQTVPESKPIETIIDYLPEKKEWSQAWF